MQRILLLLAALPTTLWTAPALAEGDPAEEKFLPKIAQRLELEHPLLMLLGITDIKVDSPNMHYEYQYRTPGRTNATFAFHITVGGETLSGTAEAYSQQRNRGKLHLLSVSKPTRLSIVPASKTRILKSRAQK